MNAEKKPKPRDTPTPLLDWAERAGADVGEAREAWAALESNVADSRKVSRITVSDSTASSLQLALEHAQERIRTLRGQVQDPEASGEMRALKEERSSLLRQIADAERNNDETRDALAKAAAETTHLRNMARSLTVGAVQEAVRLLAGRINDLMLSDPLFLRFPGEAPDEVRALVLQAREGERLFGALAPKVPSIFNHFEPEVADAVSERCILRT